MASDVIVVGAGVIGTAVTCALARRGIRVTCVGTSAFGAGTASTAAGAMLGVLGEVTSEAGSDLDKAELRMRAASARLHGPFLDEIEALTGHCVPLTRGTFVVATTVNAADGDNLQAIEAAAQSLGLGHERVDHRSVPGYRPARGHEPVGVLFLPDEGFVDSHLLMTALAGALERLPAVTVVQDEAAAVLVRDDAVCGIRLRDGTVLRARQVVLANGVGVQKLVDGLGDLPGRLPRLLPGKGVSLLAQDVDDAFPYVIRTPNRDFACGSHIVPRADGSLYLGATNRVSATPGSGESVTLGEIHGLLHSVIHEINVSVRTASLVSARYGLRPLTNDRYPLIGPTELDGLWIATGTYRNGILLAPAIAEIIAADIAGEAPPMHNAFSPAAEFRRDGQAGGFDDPLREGLRHLVSFIMEPGGHLPYDRYHELRSFLTEITMLALSEDASYNAKRVEARELIARHPIAEMIPQLYYQLAQDG